MTLPSPATMHEAFANKDAAFDGIFIVGVKTTGVFCRPTCEARKAKRENIEFFPSTRVAIQNGYRPCKLCRPLESTGAAPPVVARLLDMVDVRTGDPLTESELRAMDIDPSTARRQFREFCGMSFAAYQRAARMGTALRVMREEGDVPLAREEAGFESESGFRSAFRKMFGASPSRTEGMDVIYADWIRTPIGTMFAATDDVGLIMLEFANQNQVEKTAGELKRRLLLAGRWVTVVRQKHATLQLVRDELDQYFAGKLRSFSTPLNPHGTDFEKRVWDYLLTIPFGQTRSYGEQAAGIGSAKAARAVGRANGCNMLGIVIPCHRVIGANGSLTGFGGGIARKRWLLEHEQCVARPERVDSVANA